MIRHFTRYIIFWNINSLKFHFILLQTAIYVYNQGEKDYLVNFSGLTKRDGSFIVSREKYENFTLKDMIGKTVIGGRKGVLLLNL